MDGQVKEVQDLLLFMTIVKPEVNIDIELNCAACTVQFSVFD